MSRGSLFQYKEQCYGRYHRHLPKYPFAPFELLASVNNNVMAAYAKDPNGFANLSQRETARKKYALFCATQTRVLHPRFPAIGCNYLKCFISDPYLEGETIDGWVRVEWVEPLNEVSTYFDEHLIKIQKRLTTLSPQEQKPELKDFTEWAKQARYGKKPWGDS